MTAPAPASRFEWISRPARRGIMGWLRQILPWLRQRLLLDGREGDACPRCLALVRRNAKRCRRCGEELQPDDLAGALQQMGIAWPAPAITVQPPEPTVFSEVEPERLRLRELVEAEILAPGDAYSILRCLADHRLGKTIIRYPHQIETVRRVLGDMHGRAILADEVGLGKTIEAGLVLAELRARRLCQHALVLVPPALLDQWQGELTEKLDLPVSRLQDPAELTRPPEVGLLSLYTARGPRFSEPLLGQRWDLVIVDEAHRLRNPRTQLHRLVRGLQTRSLLLLTATPIQTSLLDLYHLAGLVKPGALGRPGNFRNAFVDCQNQFSVRDPRRLRMLLREVMIRNRRSTAGVRLPSRRAAIHWVHPSDGEREIAATVTGLVRVRQTARGIDLLRLAQLQRRLTSTPAALASVLHWLDGAADPGAFTDALQEADPGQKIRAFQDLSRRFPDDQILVFSEFPESVERLAGQLTDWGETVRHWHGGMRPAQRTEAIERFRRGACRILVGTDTLAEGQNLQHCRIVVNLDLPWNPFRIEQRIGRVHRLGQQREVFVISLVARQTFEADLVTLFARRLHLFELSVGELDPILGDLAESEQDFEQLILRIALADESDRERELAKFGETLEQAHSRYLDLSRRQEALADLGVQS